MNPAHLVRDALLPLGRRLGSRPASGDPRTILILQPDHLGDILLSQPAVLAIRGALPDYRLVAVVGPWSERIARLAWPVDELVTVAFPGFTRSGQGPGVGPYRQLQRDAARLRGIGAGSAVVLRPDAWWAAWLAWLSVPGAVVTADDERAARFATLAVPLNDGLHAAERAFAIVGALVNQVREIEISSMRRSLTLPASEAAARQARELLGHHGVTGEYLVVHPGSGAPVKLWPPVQWQGVIRQFDSLPVVLTGGETERGLCAAVARGIENVHNLAGETPLEVLVEMLRGARAVAGPDSGPLHLAVAAGTPSVHLFGPSDPVRYGPWGPPERHRVIRAGWSCPRCGDLSLSRKAGCGCMLAITAPEVARAIREVGNSNDD